MSDDKQMKKKYAKRIGIAGDTLCQRNGALRSTRLVNDIGCLDSAKAYEKIKNKTEGAMTMVAVPILRGLSLAFCNRPPQQKTVLPEKYW